MVFKVLPTETNSIPAANIYTQEMGSISVNEISVWVFGASGLQQKHTPVLQV